MLVDVGDTTFLVDPMFTRQGEMPTVTESPGVPEFLTTANEKRNPLVPLPEVELDYDAVVVTHRHPDHWDEAARRNSTRTCRCSVSPRKQTRSLTRASPTCDPSTTRRRSTGVTIHRTPGQTRPRRTCRGNGPGLRFVFEGEKTVYVAGDTIWYEPVEETLNQFEPEMVVLNGGEAQFDQGEPITMGVEDITAVREATDAESWSSTWKRSITACSLARNCGRRQRTSTSPKTGNESLGKLAMARTRLIAPDEIPEEYRDLFSENYVGDRDINPQLLANDPPLLESLFTSTEVMTRHFTPRRRGTYRPYDRTRIPCQARVAPACRPRA